MERIHNHIQRCLARLASQFKGATNTKALLSELAARWQTIEDLTQDVFHGTSLPKSRGVQLDVIGILLGERRLGRSDSDYRIALGYRVQRNHSNGEPWRLIAVYKFLTGAERVRYRETYPRTIWLDAWSPAVSCEEEAAIITAMNQIRAGAFRLMLLRTLADEAFAYDGSEPGLGYGEGYYAIGLRTSCPTVLGTLLADPLTSGDGWATVAGAPTFAAGAFGGGTVYRNLGAAHRVILGSVHTAPGVGENFGVTFCSNAGVTAYYQIGATNTGWFLLKDGAPIDSCAVAPVGSDRFEVIIPDDDGEPIEAYINGELRMDSSDTANRDNTHMLLSTVGSAKIGIYETYDGFIVQG